MTNVVPWNPHEVSLGRESFNTLVAPAGGRLDVTEVMMKMSTISRQAQVGPAWSPPGLVSRHLATSLVTSSGRQPLAATRDLPGAISAAIASRAATATATTAGRVPEVGSGAADGASRGAGSGGRAGRSATAAVGGASAPRARPPPRAAAAPSPWAPPSAPLAAVAHPGPAREAAPTLPMSWPGAAKVRASTPRALEDCSSAKKTTTLWPIDEGSMRRASFNAVVTREALDVTGTMAKDLNMSRQVTLGPSWMPPGLASRKIAELLSGSKKPLARGGLPPAAAPAAYTNVYGAA